MRKNLIKKLIATLSLSLAIASVGSNVFVYGVCGDRLRFTDGQHHEYYTWIDNTVGRERKTYIYSLATGGAGRIGPLGCWVSLETHDSRLAHKSSGKVYGGEYTTAEVDVRITDEVSMYTEFGARWDTTFVRSRYFTA